MRFFVILILLISIFVMPITYSQDCTTEGHCVPNQGASCNCGACGCGGTIQCDGSCSGSDPTPGNYNQPCGYCGRGRINCAGSCSGDYSNCGSAGWYNTGSSCGNCGTQQQYCNGCDWTGQYQCINQGPCSLSQTQNLGSCGNCGTLQQTCQSNCQYGAAQCINQGSCSPGQTETQTQNCGAGNCGTQSSTRTCSSSCSWGSWSSWSSCTLKSGNACFDGQTQCSGGRYQTCSSCQWQNSGTNADGDSKDLQCGDSLCDNSPNVYDSTKTATENACSDNLDNDCDLKTDCNDNDCDGSITGTVKNQNNQSVSGADVSAKKDLITVKSTITNPQGSYTISPINCGTYNLVASHPDYAPQTRSNFQVDPQQQETANFGGPDSGALVLGTSCESDCTFAADEIIHASCDGKNSCSFYDSISKAACDNSQPGWVRDYSQTHYVVCASGAPQPKVEIQASVSCASGTLVKVVSIVLHQGKPVKLVVATCG